MTIKFERGLDYDRIPDEHKEIAEEYLLKGEFESIQSALRQEFDGSRVVYSWFEIGEVRVRPRALPLTIDSVVIQARVCEDPGYPELYDALRATYSRD
tara:strand:+ start:901 stop:1194 length:294 start_codon:yes stop_codon:yes gene_type:complete